MEQNYEFSQIWNPDAIWKKSDKIWPPLSRHKWLTAIRIPHLYLGVLSNKANVAFTAHHVANIWLDRVPILISERVKNCIFMFIFLFLLIFLSLRGCVKIWCTKQMPRISGVVSVYVM